MSQYGVCMCTAAATGGTGFMWYRVHNIYHVLNKNTVTWLTMDATRPGVEPCPTYLQSSRELFCSCWANISVAQV